METGLPVQRPDRRRTGGGGKPSSPPLARAPAHRLWLESIGITVELTHILCRHLDAADVTAFFDHYVAGSGLSPGAMADWLNSLTPDEADDVARAMASFSGGRACHPPVENAGGFDRWLLQRGLMPPGMTLHALD